MFSLLHKEIINTLVTHHASYSSPLSSREIAGVLNLNPSYLRLQILFLRRIVGVRRGKNGGYFLKREVEKWLHSARKEN